MSKGDILRKKVNSFQKSIRIDLGTKLFGEGFVDFFEGGEIDWDCASGFVLGFESHADLIPADISTIQFEFITDFVIERLLEIGLPDFATFVKNGLSFGTKSFPFHVADHEIAFKAIGCVYLRFGEGNEMVYDVPFFAVPFKIVCTCGEV